MVAPTDNTPGSMLNPPGQPQPLQPGEFVPSGVANTVTFNNKLVTPPSTLYIQRDDFLIVSVATASAAPGVNLAARYLRVSDGLIQTINLAIGPITTAYVAAVFPVILAEGWLLGAALTSSATSRGLVYGALGLARGKSTTPNWSQVTQVLCSDYLTTRTAVGWPPGRVISPVEGPGRMNGTIPSAPSAGADISVPVPSLARWRILGFSAKLVTSATVANRQVALAFAGSSLTDYSGAPAAQTAGTTVIYTWANDMAQYTDARGVINIPLPRDLELAQTETFATVTQNLQAGDQWTPLAFRAEEWLDV